MFIKEWRLFKTFGTGPHGPSSLSCTSLSEVKVSGHLNVSQRSLRTAIHIYFHLPVMWGEKKTYIHLFFSFIEAQNMAKTQLTPICANGSSPSIKHSQNEPICPESNSGMFLFFAARLNFDLLSSPPRIATWLHFYIPHKLNFLRKLWQVGYPDLDKAQWREDGMKNFTDPGQQKNP